jgi:hypothetical protein
MRRPPLLLLLLATGRSVENGFFEGDILFKEEFVSGRNIGQTVLKDPTLKWPQGRVQYAFDPNSGFSDEQKGIVRTSMDRIEEMTGCVQFLEVDSDRGGDVVLVTSLGFGSHPGKG